MGSVKTDILAHLKHFADAMIGTGMKPDYLRRCIRTWRDAYGESVAREMHAYCKTRMV